MKKYVEATYITFNAGKFGPANRTVCKTEIELLCKKEVKTEINFFKKIFDDATVKVNANGTIIIKKKPKYFYSSVHSFNFRWSTYCKETIIFEPIRNLKKAVEIVKNNKVINSN